MTSYRKTALVAGGLYLLTFISIPRLALFGPVLNDPAYILGSGGDTGVLVGAVLEMIVALAIVGTGVALYPVPAESRATGHLGREAVRQWASASLHGPARGVDEFDLLRLVEVALERNRDDGGSAVLGRNRRSHLTVEASEASGTRAASMAARSCAVNAPELRS